MSKHEMLYIALVVIAVAALVGLFIWAIGRRTSRLQSAFGAEYDRTVDMAGRKAGERELAGRLEHGDPANAATGSPPVSRAAAGAEANNRLRGQIERHEGSRW